MQVGWRYLSCIKILYYLGLHAEKDLSFDKYFDTSCVRYALRFTTFYTYVVVLRVVRNIYSYIHVYSGIK